MAKILVVDDDDNIRMLLRIMLNALGHEIVECANGHQALQAVEVRRFDLVLTDLIMPEKEGIETIMDLRRLHPSLKIIAMSGGGVGSQRDYLSLAEKLGAARTLAKPFDSQELREVLDAVLSSPDQVA